MKKIKKVLAMIMAMAMIMGLGMTAFAANKTAQISVSGLAATGTNTVTYYKILEADTTKESGYDIVDGVTLGNYTTAKDFLAADIEDQKAALVEENLGAALTGNVTGTTFTAEVEAGYYAVFITNTAADGDPEIIYTNPMIVSVEYNKATLVNGNYEYNAVAGENNKVVAKYTTIPTTKTSDDEDGVVEIGREVTYTVKTYVPSQIEDSDGIKSYVITDTLTGADYVKDSETVKIAGTEVEPDSVVYDLVNNPQTLTITLTNKVAGNEGKLVEITYKAIVTDTRVNNEVVPSTPNHTFKPAEEWLFTGAIKLVKTGVGEDAQGLNDADFVVYKDGSEGAEFLKVGTDGSYTWVADQNDATIFTTDTVGEEAGVILIEGLDKGTYWFKEVEAPEGYSINTTDVSATIDDDNLTSEAVATAVPADTSMTDTKLSSLPSTGGIGTTIFTIGGIVIMIAAAALFFANRRKNNA